MGILKNTTKLLVLRKKLQNTLEYYPDFYRKVDMPYF